MTKGQTHCCAMMMEQVNLKCADHPDRFDCPDALVNFFAKPNVYGLIVHDGGSSFVEIAYCPWCGTRLTQERVQDGEPSHPVELR